MNKKNYGYTLIEMITTLVIASAFSIGIYFIFISSSLIKKSLVNFPGVLVNTL